MEYRKLNLLNKEDRDIFERFYNDIFVVEFPDDDEAETIERFVDEYRTAELNKDNHIIATYVVIDNGVPVAGFISDLFRHSKSVLLEYIAVREDYQRRHVGEFLFQHAVNDIFESFQDTWNCAPVLMFWETEDYQYCLEHDILATRSKRWSFFTHMGANKVCMGHIQPPLEDGKNPVKHLDLCLWRFNRGNVMTVKREDVLMFLHDYYTYAIGCSEETKADIFDSVKDTLTDIIKLEEVLCDEE